MNTEKKETKEAVKEVQEILLPRKAVEPELVNTKSLLIYGKPKIGKTTSLTFLKNCLIMDLKEETAFLKAMSIKAPTINSIRKITAQIRKEGKPYDYIALDNLSDLEEMCIAYAEYLYSKTPMGKYWLKAKDSTKKSGKATYGNILHLPDGAGYAYLRTAFMNVIDLFQDLAKIAVIFIAHVKDARIDEKDSEISSFDIDLTGKLKRIMAKDVHAIAYMKRKKDQNILVFKTGDDISAGSRPKHLQDKEIVVSQKNKDGSITGDWSEVFI